MSKHGSKIIWFLVAVAIAGAAALSIVAQPQDANAGCVGSAAGGQNSC
jgi:hypothetical protein